MDTVYRRVREVLYRDWSDTKDIGTPGGCNVAGQTRCPCVADPQLAFICSWSLVVTSGVGRECCWKIEHDSLIRLV